MLYGNLPHAKREKSDTEIRMTNTAVQVKQNRHYSSRVISIALKKQRCLAISP